MEASTGWSDEKSCLLGNMVWCVWVLNLIESGGRGAFFICPKPTRYIEKVKVYCVSYKSESPQQRLTRKQQKVNKVGQHK